MVKIGEVHVERTPTEQTLKGRIGSHELRYAFGPELALCGRGEPFLAMGLLAAMAQGEPLQFDDSAPLDPSLVSSLPLIQAILVQWDPNLKRVEIQCRTETSDRLNCGQIASFSGGVDSCATLIDNSNAISHLLTINGFDAQSHGEDLVRLQQKIETIARRLGKQMVVVDTNIRQVCSALSLSWNVAHGPALCLLAAGLGFEKFYIPASYTYRDLKPWGSHPVLDPLWSTSTTQIVHDGAQRTRSEKIELIARHEVLLSNLQVCWGSQSENCGRCSKCARTLLVLNALEDRKAPFPPTASADLISCVALKTDLGATFALDLVQFLDRHEQPKLARQLRRRVQLFRLKQHGRRFVKDVFGAANISRLRRWRRPKEILHQVRVLDPADSF